MRDVPPCPCADKRAPVAGAAVIWGSTTNTQIRELRSLLIAVQGIVFALVPKYRPRTATSHGGGSRHSFNFHNIAIRPRVRAGPAVAGYDESRRPQLELPDFCHFSKPRGIFHVTRERSKIQTFIKLYLNSHITHLPTLAQDRCPTYPG